MRRDDVIHIYLFWFYRQEKTGATVTAWWQRGETGLPRSDQTWHRLALGCVSVTCKYVQLVVIALKSFTYTNTVCPYQAPGISWKTDMHMSNTIGSCLWEVRDAEEMKRAQPTCHHRAPSTLDWANPSEVLGRRWGAQHRTHCQTLAQGLFAFSSTTTPFFYILWWGFLHERALNYIILSVIKDTLVSIKWSSNIVTVTVVLFSWQPEDIFLELPLVVVILQNNPEF